MMNVHLELGQLWRCPVEWCAVWKDSVSDCLGQLHDKHGGSHYIAFKNMAKLFPPWTVTPLADDPSTRRLWDSGGCSPVPRVQMPIGPQVLRLQGPISTSSAPGGGGASPIAILCDPHYGCCAADESTHIDSGVGGVPGGVSRGVLSASCSFPGADGPPSCLIRQCDDGPGLRPNLGAITRHYDTCPGLPGCRVS